MTVRFEDVVLPNNSVRGRMLDDEGNVIGEGTASGGEVAFAYVGLAIVQHAWRVDAAGRRKLIELLLAA